MGSSLEKFATNLNASIDDTGKYQQNIAALNTAFETLIGETLFDHHHERAVAVFDQLPGLGVIMVIEGEMLNVVIESVPQIKCDLIGNP